MQYPYKLTYALYIPQQIELHVGSGPVVDK